MDFQAREQQPHEKLRPYLRSFTVMHEVHNEHTRVHAFLPEANPRLFFGWGEAYFQLTATETTPVHNGLLVSMMAQPYRMIVPHTVRAIFVDLLPWGAIHLFPLPRGLLNTLYIAEELQISVLAFEIQGLLALGEYREALELLEAWFLKRIWLADLDASKAIQAAGELMASRGQTQITHLAQELDMSTRTLQRDFHRELGITPKLYARLIRFEEAQTLLRADPTLQLTGLAYDLGYTDQAHFIHEFRALASMTPRQYTQQLLERQWLIRRSELNI